MHARDSPCSGDAREMNSPHTWGPAIQGRKYVWFCRRCKSTVPRAKRGLDSIAPKDTFLIVEGKLLNCDDIIVRNVMES